MKLAIIGTGYVGLVTGVCLAEKNHNVICIDIDEAKVNLMKQGKSPIYEPNLEELMIKNIQNGNLRFSSDFNTVFEDIDIIMIAVGTPEKIDGSANLDYLYDAAKQIAENINNDCFVIIKSTVPIGTNDEIEKYIKENLKNKVNIEVISNPEFLSQSTAIKDTMEPARIIAGIESNKAKEVINELYKDFNSPILFMNRKSSEMVKYASNDFLALKISYINEIANLCEVVGANVEDVTKGMSYDNRIGNSFLKPGCGYGGSCFPKDTKALHFLATQAGYNLELIKTTIAINKKQKIILLDKARKIFKTFKGLNVAILGLSFKPNTDDLREAPSIDNIEILLDEGANIKAYDPKAMTNLKKIYPTQIEYSNTPKQALKNADVCFIFTEWDEFKNIKPSEFTNLMNTAIVYDGRNIYDLNEMKNNGVEYYSIGR